MIPTFSERNQAAVDAVVSASQQPPAPNPRSWFLRVPAPLNQRGGPDWLSSNRTWNHWSQKAHLVKVWRLQGKVEAQRGRLPRGLARVSFDVVVHFQNRSRNRDADNVQPSWKAARDGLVDYGLITDDSDQFVVASTIRAGEVLERACLSITITEEIA